jgi:hypothetical protein
MKFSKASDAAALQPGRQGATGMTKTGSPYSRQKLWATLADDENKKESATRAMKSNRQIKKKRKRKNDEFDTRLPLFETDFILSNYNRGAIRKTFRRRRN